jgi:hypothetical protein
MQNLFWVFRKYLLTNLVLAALASGVLLFSLVLLVGHFIMTPHVAAIERIRWPPSDRDRTPREQAIAILSDKSVNEAEIVCELDDHIRSLLGNRRDFKLLIINHHCVVDADLKALENNKSLKHIAIMVCRDEVSDAGIASFKTLTSLESLQILSSDSTDELVDEILAAAANSMRLGKLAVSGTIGEKGMLAISRMKSLRELSLAYSKIRSSYLIHLSRLVAPVSLRLDGIGINDDLLMVFPAWKSLESIYLVSNPITDAGFSSVAKWTNLRALSCGHTLITAASVTSIKKLSKLKKLECGNRIIERGIVELKEWNPDIYIDEEL